MNDKLCSQLKDLTQNVDMTVKQRILDPPVYFHEQALYYCKHDFLSDKHIEEIYATLVAWGMHRPGEKGSKMPPFPEFRNSIIRNKENIESLKYYKIESITHDELDKILPRLTDICFNIEATTCSTKIVSSSKAMAHILPDLVCPIDNRYTLAFFGNNVKYLDERRKFQYVIYQMWEFYNQETIKDRNLSKGIFANSYPKIFDNLIMEYMSKKYKNENQN